LAAGVWLEVQRPKLIQTDDRVRIAATASALAVGQRVEIKPALLLGLVVGSVDSSQVFIR
jgi:hypothetical protein